MVDFSLTNFDEEYESISDIIYRKLRDQIFSGEYQIGQRLKERDLAKQMNISRTPIREAFVRLENEGLIVSQPRRGVIVKGITIEDIPEIYSLRCALECLAVETAIDRITDQEIKRLQEINARMRECLEQEMVSMEEVRGLSKRFNNALYEASKMPRLIKNIQMYSGYMSNIKQYLMPSKDRWIKDLKDHEAIVEAISEKNKQMAEALVKTHVHYAMKSLLDQYSREKQDSILQIR